jgi:hypothetical protein
VTALAEVPAAEVEALVAAGTAARLEAGEALCAMGAREHRCAFVHRGLMRYHVITEAART